MECIINHVKVQNWEGKIPRSATRCFHSAAWHLRHEALVCLTFCREDLLRVLGHPRRTKGAPSLFDADLFGAGPQ